MHVRSGVRMHSVTVAVSAGEGFHYNGYTEHEKTQKLKRSTSSKHVVRRVLLSARKLRKHALDQGVSIRASDCHGFLPPVTVSKFGSFSDCLR